MVANFFSRIGKVRSSRRCTVMFDIFNDKTTNMHKE